MPAAPDVGGGLDLATQDLEVLWLIVSALALCQDAGLRALYEAGELEVAAALSARQAQELMALLRPLGADGLARRVAAGIAFEDRAALRQRVLPQAQTLLGGLRESVGGLHGRSLLTRELIDRGHSGPAYLRAIEAEQEAPFLFLPSSGGAPERAVARAAEPAPSPGAAPRRRRIPGRWW
ncbi:hypothetical protein KM176_09935 [Pseudooceanicola sp. CBS1P-1]|uniref:Uncharacterized protein n=1 Tax=Pseudooceanicola albus TaxID=2692189 RepID=A0A6L7GAC6_9RHOB|nr:MULTISPECIES: hypothetical protein [Pseudooceanicola]MBT9384178.1 hypothetical protein [Pseudooceanicola endophyticus]MXN19723.1 hypothetical protein [Pseudooceanicola albus]